MTAGPRSLRGADLAAALRDARATTLDRSFDLDDWTVPEQAGVNPIDWELGHLAWFAEFWILRGPHAVDAEGRFVDAARPPRIAGPDATFDSARLGHAARWRTPMPLREALRRRLDEQLDACIAAIPGAAATDAATADAAHEMHRLVLFHEDMHGEAFAWLRDALARPAPSGLAAMPSFADAPALRLAPRQAELGRPPGDAGFAFDNERPGVRLAVDAFEIDAAPRTAADFLAFVDAGGYDDPAWWPGDAGRWRQTQDRRRPVRWKRDGSAWLQRDFDRWRPLALDEPAVHVSAFEAEAWARWAGRRLPTAAEWEVAAADPRFRWGASVWEWTADAFLPYPGFAPGPYRDYSAPWFGHHRELRGGSRAAHARLHDRRYRNFFTPDRSDVFAGFRTAALTHR